MTLQFDLYGGRADQPGIRDTKTAGGNLLGRWTHTFSPDASFQLQWYLDRTERDIPNSIREELDTHDLDLQHHVIIGPDFQSETLLAYELGYRAHPTPRLSLSVATFYNEHDDIRSVEQVNPPAARPLVIRNGLEGETYGAELTAEYRLADPRRLQAGYTRLIVHLRAKPGSTDIGAGLSEAKDARNQLFLRSSSDLPWRLEFDVGLRHIGDVANQGPPSYQELEMRLGWRPSDRLELSVVGQNLMDARHAEFGTPASRHEIERSVYGKIL